jgi:hypothetical protein
VTEQDYVASVLDAYVALPDTTCRPRCADRTLAHQLFAEGVPREVVLDALLLAHARRHLNPASPPMPVRSLHYFLPVIREMASLDPALRAMMRASVDRHLPPHSTSGSPTLRRTSAP